MTAGWGQSLGPRWTAPGLTGIAELSSGLRVWVIGVAVGTEAPCSVVFLLLVFPSRSFKFINGKAIFFHLYVLSA